MLGGIGVTVRDRGPVRAPTRAAVGALPVLIGSDGMVRTSGRTPGQPHLLVPSYCAEIRRPLRRIGMHGHGTKDRGGDTLAVGVFRPQREGVGGVVGEACHGVLGFIVAVGTRIAAVRNVRPGGCGRVRVRRVFVAGDGAAVIAGRRRPGKRHQGIARGHA